MKFNKAKCNILYLGWGYHQYQCKLSDEQIESSPLEKDLGIFIDERLDMSWQCALAAQRANHILRSCVCPIPGSVQGQVGWGFEQPDLVKDASLMVGGLVLDDL
ncbi:hypothetical protein QYF61_021965 [Mycteria americana]|uniref:Uncharacterized protein n=1 Tax=Mycteria americana TaxID=33587 RepID=A0AAN7SJ90_MYCAM|nr:hypothetical protein QYF61_021965 [Mycteria americana]